MQISFIAEWGVREAGVPAPFAALIAWLCVDFTPPACRVQSSRTFGKKVSSRVILRECRRRGVSAVRKGGDNEAAALAFVGRTCEVKLGKGEAAALDEANP
jgi:hypothetical protein